MTEPAAIVRRPLNSPRAAALAGVLFAVLFTTSLVLLRSSFPDGLTATIGWLDEGATARITVALGIVPFAGIAFLWFMGVVRDGFKDAEDQLFSSVFIGSGLLFLAMVFVSSALAGGIIAAAQIITNADDRSVVVSFGRAIMLQVSNVYALRMAGVLLISLGTMWLRTGVMPRWLAFVTYAVALVLLVVTTLSLWVTLIFPAWVLVVSLLILVQNYRRTHEQPAAA
ncbi:hypothetical protein SAMN04487846_2675 [Microbacterium sp. cf046]|uniref:hypothetical protein n=1 Tax=Microbacterium sp. cf046 TaxID=1761803 RepID=UPI0008E0E1AA|nr:hypothetical protein [Microbacterium sp. cf046]SFS13395.1 hypothetical protein SAMN04487846_2675 [Microbacterium sp. cf046]